MNEKEFIYRLKGFLAANPSEDSKLIKEELEKVWITYPELPTIPDPFRPYTPPYPALTDWTWSPGTITTFGTIT